jgi:hypothetical protein
MHINVDMSEARLDLAQLRKLYFDILHSIILFSTMLHTVAICQRHGMRITYSK